MEKKRLTKDEIVDRLVADGETRESATLYAHAYLEYQEATRNIDDNGIIVSHPRTANPIENPYLAIRDRAAKKLKDSISANTDFLWT